MAKRLCTKEIPSHEEASKIHKQLTINPEVCESCKIKPCTYGLYVFGSKERIAEYTSNLNEQE